MAITLTKKGDSVWFFPTEMSFLLFFLGFKFCPVLWATHLGERTNKVFLDDSPNFDESESSKIC